MTELDVVIESVGPAWRDRYYNRPSFIKVKYDEISTHVPELKAGGKRVLDVSCGTGVMMEILKHYGNEVFGIEPKNGIFHRILRTQGIDFTEFDCSKPPYPFPDKSFDYVINIGAIEQYRVEWIPIVEEFMRLAKECVFVFPNQGKQMDEWRQRMNMFEPKGWKLKAHNDTFKWTNA